MSDATSRHNVRENLTLLLLLSLLAASLSLNVFLGWKVSGSVGLGTLRGGIQAGALLRSLNVVDADGTKVELKFVGQESPTLLYVLSPTCGWCSRNQENIAAIARGAASRYRVAGLSTTSDGLPQYLLRVAPPFHVYSMDSAKIPQNVDFKVTPQTVVIGTDGTVQRAWVGAYTENRVAEIERFFSVKLPGLRPDTVAH